MVLTWAAVTPGTLLVDVGSSLGPYEKFDPDSYFSQLNTKKMWSFQIGPLRFRP